jgi:hypothetical protein
MSWAMIKLTFFEKSDLLSITVEKAHGQWLLKILPKLSLRESKVTTLSELKADFESQFDDFELFWFSKPVQALRTSGLLLL